jgi:hypothetical protein
MIKVDHPCAAAFAASGPRSGFREMKSMKASRSASSQISWDWRMNRGVSATVMNRRATPEVYAIGVHNSREKTPLASYRAWAIPGLCGGRMGSGWPYKKRSSGGPGGQHFHALSLPGNRLSDARKCLGYAPVRLRITKPAYFVQISCCWGFEGPAREPKPSKRTYSACSAWQLRSGFFDPWRTAPAHGRPAGYSLSIEALISLRTCSKVGRSP